MFSNLRRTTARNFYNWRCKGILDTPPIVARGDSLTFVSMASHADLIMYLVAIKSVHRWVDDAKVVVINDGSMTPEDLETLSRHIRGLEVVHIEDIDTGRCPRGGTWERLVHIIDRSQSSYVVQVDSDVLAFGDIATVRDAVRDNRSFALGTMLGRNVISTADAAKLASRFDSDHVQVLSEKCFGQPPFSGHSYIRGCSGFSGFAVGSASRAGLETFSLAVQERIGDKWLEWGSEQVSSNYTVANSGNAFVLPQPAFRNFVPDADPAESSLFHFIGSDRFKGGRYIAISRNIIRELKS